ncbi:MAG: hypothetical protein JO043_12885 [Candidatus Eremiobacteraeota bacterium]|nr:hypothetical protein [Candidatus Eremiobacteraeota bacterium]
MSAVLGYLLAAVLGPYALPASVALPLNGLRLPHASANIAAALRYRPRSFSPQHIYVADPGSEAILRYPLTHGLPSVTPDLTIGGVAPTFLGIDGAGEIFSASNDPSSGQCSIDVFDANGNHLRSILLGYSVGAVGVDSQGYLCTVVGQYGSVIFAYAPGTSGYYPSPVASLMSQDKFFGVTPGPLGRLFAVALFTIDVFEHPTKDSKAPSWQISRPSQFFSFEGPATFDERGWLYAAESPLGIYSNWQSEEFDVIHPLRGSHRQDRLIMARDCWNFSSEPSQPHNPGTITGMTVSQGYLEDACVGATPPTVYVYHADRYHKQHVVEVLQGAKDPTDVKVGP